MDFLGARAGRPSAALVPALCFLLLSGCAGLVQKGGEVLEGNVFNGEKILAVYRSGDYDTGNGEQAAVELKVIKLKSGGGAVEITGAAWPGLVLRGSEPEGRTGAFELTEARVLSTHVHGWNEFTLELSGGAAFWAPGEDVGNLRVGPDIERVQISSGKIRLKNSRLAGAEALTALRNRRERILALTEWMRGDTAAFAGAPALESQKDFDAYWKPRVLPETVSRKKRPPEYSSHNALWGRADSVRWNQSYTDYLFPGELRELRNSGALLRDWEEALPWIYMAYSWDRIIGSFNDIILHNITR